MVHKLDRKEATRVLARLLHMAAAGPSMLALPLALAQAIPPRPVLTAAQVIAAMQDRQLPTDGVEVRLAADITSAVTRPALEIQSMVPLNAHEVRLRITCRDRSECLPFFAVATYSQAIDPTALEHDSKLRAAAATSVASTTTTPIAPVLTPVTMRIGSPATLDFDEARVHVRVDVICLENGASGDRIRVTTRDHKQIYVAEILSPGNLKGTLTR